MKPLKLKIKKNMYFYSFKSQQELKKTILQFIYLQKASKIIYKGDPKEIKYKLLKKIVTDSEESEINNYIKFDKTKSIRDNFNQFIDTIGNSPCLIYKS